MDITVRFCGATVKELQMVWREAVQEPLDVFRLSFTHQVSRAHSDIPRPTPFPAGPEDANVAARDGRAPFIRSYP